MEFKDAVYFISLKYCRNTLEAEDNLHDTFVIVFETIKSYKGKGSLEGWIKRIAINKAVDKFKRNIRDTENELLEIKEDTLEDNLVYNLDLNTILNCIQELPDRYRLVFNLYELDGYTHKEIADLLGISEGTSKSNFHRAKQILKQKITLLIGKSEKHTES